MDSTAIPRAVADQTDISALILDATPAAMFSINAKAHVVHWNEAASNLTGISARDVLGRSYPENVLIAEDVAQWHREFARILAGCPSIRTQFRWKIPGGSRPRICVHSSVHDREGAFLYIVSTLIADTSPVDDLINDWTADRRNISRFLHDTVSQDLVALSFSLNRRQAGSTDSDAGVNVDLVSRCCGDIRVIMSLLAPLVSGVEGIAGTIYQYAEQLKRDAGMTIIAHCGPGLGNVSYEIQSLMLSALQEWISRTALKREKTSLFINLQNSANGIVLELETVFGDNITEASLTQGWTAVRERAAALGGKLEIISESSRSLARILIPEST